MANPVIFKDLPATFPEKDKFKKPSMISSVIFHALLIIALIVIPLMFPKTIEEWQLMTMLVSPPPPPPAAPPAPVEVEAPPAATPKAPVQVKLDPDSLFVPLVIPKDIAHVVDDPIAPSSGVVGGVPGGMPGGVAGGVLGGILAASARDEASIPPPPPPPAPPAPPLKIREPIRVGGAVKEPQILRLVPPVYPILAMKARVTGTVILEATLTADGRVDNIRVVSGHPLLVNAAIDCVKQWVYEPTYLNGTPVEVILTAIVKFQPRTTL